MAAAAAGGFLLARGERDAGALVFLAAVVYVFGALAPTVVVNMPMNDELDGAGTPGSGDEAQRRRAA